MIKTVQPVMGADERDAAVTALRWMLAKGVLVPGDEDKVAGAIEAMTTAPPGPQLLSSSATKLGPFRRESEESRRAAIQNYPRSGTQREMVLRRIARRGLQGATRDELCQWMGVEVSTINPRVRELIDGGWIQVKLAEDGAKAATRKTRSGNAAAILVLTDRGRAELRRRGQRVFRG